MLDVGCRMLRRSRLVSPPAPEYSSVVKRAFIFMLCSLVVLYLAVVGLFAFNQRRLMYFPGRLLGPEEKMVYIAAPLGLEPWRDAQGVRIGWRQVTPPTGKASQRMVVFHGNAGTAFERSQYLMGFGRMDQGRTWQVFLFEYPGYDARPGQAERNGCSARPDAKRSRNWPRRIRGRFISRANRSGAGVACALAGELPQRIAGVFLMTPFAALSEVGAHHYPWLPVGLILRDRWDNVAALRKYHGPVAIMIAGQAEVLTAPQSRKLFDSYSGPKRDWFDADATHNTVINAPTEPWWREVTDFLLKNSPPHS